MATNCEWLSLKQPLQRQQVPKFIVFSNNIGHAIPATVLPSVTVA